MCENITINISGTRFTTSLLAVLSKPDTKLARKVRSVKTERRIGKDIFFDRNAEFFSYILDYHRNGELHVPFNACPNYFKQELDFWEISPYEISPCCFDKISESEETNRNMKYFENSQPKTNDSETLGFRMQIFQFLDNPLSSRAAKIPAILHLFVCMLAIVSTFLVVDVRTPINDPITSRIGNMTNGTNEKVKRYMLTRPDLVSFIIWNGCACFFLLEFLLRFFLSPFKKGSWKSFFNVLDICVVLPMLSATILEFLKFSDFVNETFLIILLSMCSCFNVILVIRLLKYVRHCQGLKVLYLTVKSSLPEIGLLVLFVSIASLTFCFLIHAAEIYSDRFFNTMLEGLWWSVITMTTIGYGDMYPVTPPGYFIGTVCALTGMILTALPIAVLSSNFNIYLKMSKQYQTREKLGAQPCHIKKCRKTLGDITQQGNSYA